MSCYPKEPVHITNVDAFQHSNNSVKTRYHAIHIRSVNACDCRHSIPYIGMWGGVGPSFF